MIAIARPAVAALLAAAATVATAGEWGIETGLHAHRLREQVAGSSFVREAGTGAALRAVWRSDAAPDAWGLRASAGGWAARAAYDGHTQAGQAITSDTDTQSFSVEAIALRRFGASGWHAGGGLEAERFRRRIRPVAGNAGLDERLTQARWRLDALWRDESGSFGFVARAGSRGPLTVRFDGAVYDTVTLRSGRSRGFGLEIVRELGDAWRLGLSFDHLAVDDSERAALASGGQPVGSVTQPRWRRESAVIALERCWR